MASKNLSTYSTSYSLIDRVTGEGAELAWEEFSERYRPFIYYVLKEMNFPQSDQDDICQEILIKLFKSLHSYCQKGRFRSWLSVVIRNTANDHLRKKRALPVEDEILNSLREIEQYEDDEFERLILKEWQNFVFQEAMQCLEKIFESNIINCFKMTLEEVPVEQIEKDLNLTKESIYVLRSRLKKRLLREMRKISRELEF